MGVIDFFWHLANFCAPAAVVAVLVAAFASIFKSKPRSASVFRRFIAINFVVCMVALVAGLAYFGNDGKMATYSTMVLAVGTSQWLLLKGWRG